MAFEQRPNTGTLFRNGELASNPKAPNMWAMRYCSSPMAVSLSLDIAAWLKERPKAGKFYSLSARLKQSRDKIGDQPPPIDDLPC